jgi:putative colanic acid biosynthesis glycosyltransferase
MLFLANDSRDGRGDVQFQQPIQQGFKANSNHPTRRHGARMKPASLDELNRDHHNAIRRNTPLITIITVVFNGAATLERTLQSVLNQTYGNIEYVVIDGGSSDGTIDLIRKYAESIDYWVSEADGGIYDAMNKGVAASSGDYILFLNADDFFYSSSIVSTIARTILNDIPHKALYYGDVVYGNGKCFFSRMSSAILVINTIHHQGAFYRREVFSNFKYDSSLTVAADYELNLKIYLNKCSTRKIPGVIAVCETLGISQTAPDLKVNYENHIVRKRYISWILSMLTFILAMLNVFRRRILPKRD